MLMFYEDSCFVMQNDELQKICRNFCSSTTVASLVMTCWQS